MDKQKYEADPRAYWDLTRPEGESINSINERDPRGMALWVAHVFPEILANPGRDICLDLGCGGGRYIPQAALQFKKVIGIDFSVSNLETAQSSLSSLGIPNVEFCNSDLGDMLGFSEAYADFAYSMAVFMHMPNDTKRRALKELHRVLKPEGIAVLVEIVPISPGAFDCPDIEEWEWEDMIAEAGLKIVDIESADPFMKYKLRRAQGEGK